MFYRRKGREEEYKPPTNLRFERTKAHEGRREIRIRSTVRGGSGGSGVMDSMVFVRAIEPEVRRGYIT
jgi:hypothetical protein